jgi:hypothetical protein
MTAVRDELIGQALPLVPIAARKFPRLPPGINVEDLESAGNDALVEAAARFDPACGVPWKNFAYKGLKLVMQNVIREQRRRAASALQPVVDGQDLPPPRDPRAADPADAAAARELVGRPRRRLSAQALGEALPSPAEVADQVTRLRAAMFGAVSERDVADVMQSVVAKAKGGNMGAAKLLVDLLGPGRSGVTVNQQVVAIRTGDLD